MLQSNRAASDGTKDHRIGNRLGKFSPTAVKGLYMYPVCGEKGQMLTESQSLAIAST